MSFRHYLLLGVVGLCACTSLRTARAQSPDPNSRRWKGVVALSEFLASKGSESLQEFVQEKVSPALRKDLGRKQLTESLEELRSGFQGAKLEGAQPQGEFAAQISFSNDQTISFQIEPKPPHRFVRIGSIRKESSPNSNGGDGGADKSSAITTLDELQKKLRTDAESEAFSGVVLIAEGGKPIFHEAYGYADKNAGTPNNKQTKQDLYEGRRLSADRGWQTEPRGQDWEVSSSIPAGSRQSDHDPTSAGTQIGLGRLLGESYLVGAAR